jgi:HTH-type transcriptional regulator / antitoxin HigA
MTINPADYRTPGQLLTAALKDRGWNNRVFATVMGLSEPTVSKLTSDQQSFSAEFAVQLEEVFEELEAGDFLSKQYALDLAIAKAKKLPDPGRATRAYIYGGLPIAEMIKRGWLHATDPRDVHSVEKALEEFFGEPLDALPILPHAPKKAEVGADVTPAQLAWLYRVKQIAEEILVARYSEATCRAAIKKLGDLLGSAEDVRRVPRILTEAGIRYVIVEALPKAKIDGVCFWLNDSAPVIGMSLRFDRIDNFWFVLRHEMEHVLQGHGKTIYVVDAELEGEGASTEHVINEERIANLAAAEFCIPQDQLQRFMVRKGPFYAERDIIGFARTLDVHPGLVAGQLRHKTGHYEKFTKHLDKIRDLIRPNAFVDGWGDVAPIDS